MSQDLHPFKEVSKIGNYPRQRLPVRVTALADQGQLETKRQVRKNPKKFYHALGLAFSLKNTMVTKYQFHGKYF